MDLQDNISDILAELDGVRIARGMSFQDVADCCAFSKSTVCRILNGQSDATVQQLQLIAAAVQYKPQQPEVTPVGYTQEDYIAFLQASIQRQADDTELRIRSLHAHYNGLLRQSRRNRNLWAGVAIALIAAFVSLFAYDFLHLDRGWIQAALTKASPENIRSALLSVFHKIWSV